ncbi:MAG: dienelactone hydrolase family protein [Gemmatimonadetes bacterium]|uniref:Dienelactone hydrolase family protein n=1 Tax=Candidatus Kutchimonas denitrificans TaxID=3056748 RepID=A0AAE4ZC80_9BACT|nr:dienelactone hydrolase family protein [Gemmatimonadota bacterium]NIR74890.1 dienelactone hydrolase family protein [Candidatus Kutchimonas denitrificans]NIS00002.1 dienelactone hydrolase family protein [Gemmatimonadota bacterium]NIT65585.1 dienelactone hydrolase family protein [Gemmatimonadota bacterium]NIU52555.1 dienelactone hydrolase family protein [Gemmatimonadota bacterium]
MRTAASWSVRAVSVLALAVTPAASASAQELPADAEAVEARLESSPRHGEWVQYDAGSGDSVLAWVVYPERSDPAPVVVVIHEIFGLTDWVRGVADQLAAEGFIAVAPDLLSGKGPGGGGTESFESGEVRRAIRELDRGEIVRRLNGAVRYATSLPAATSSFASIGFCWGGSVSFMYATAQPELDAAVVYYGTAPDAEALADIEAPVLGLYGGDDARVNATIGPAEEEMARLGKFYEYEIYDGAGHGFLRRQDGRDGANLNAAQNAWPRAVAFLKGQLGDM